MRSCERYEFLSFICHAFFFGRFIVLVHTESTSVGGLYIHTYGSIRG